MLLYTTSEGGLDCEEEHETQDTAACYTKSALKLVLTATSATMRPSAIAAWIARKFDPPPDTKMARRGFRSVA